MPSPPWSPAPHPPWAAVSSCRARRSPSICLHHLCPTTRPKLPPSFSPAASLVTPPVISRHTFTRSSATSPPRLPAYARICCCAACRPGTPTRGTGYFPTLPPSLPPNPRPSTLGLAPVLRAAPRPPIHSPSLP